MAEEIHIIPEEYLCPITHQLMKNPVVAADGFTYEKSAISLWLKKGHHRSPVTNERLLHNSLTPNSVLKNIIDKYRSELPLIQRENQVKVNIKKAINFKEEVLKQAKTNNQKINRIEAELNTEKNKVEKLANELEELKQKISENFDIKNSQKTTEISIDNQYPNTRSKTKPDKVIPQSKPRKKAKISTSLSLNFKTLAGHTFSLQVQKNDTIEQVKNKIFDQEGFLQAEQVLIFSGKELTDKEKISEINLQKDSIIAFMLNPYKNSNENQGLENYLIYVKTLTGTTLEFTINADDTAKSLKAKIQEAEGIPPDMQRLVFQGKQLEDGPTLASYGVVYESEVWLILRLAGC